MVGSIVAVKVNPIFLLCHMITVFVWRKGQASLAALKLLARSR